MSMNRYLINGRFLCRQTTGVDRFAFELLRAIDEMGVSGVSLAVPKNVDIASLPFRNISIVRIGHFCGNVWEQLEFGLYCLWKGRIPVNFCNTAPLVRPGVVCIHDMQIRVHPENYSCLFVWWYRILYWVETRFARRVLTVSHFSMQEIRRFYPSMPEERISVVYNGWQHMNRVTADESILFRLGLTAGYYYYAMAGGARNKNLSWICAAAQKESGRCFVVSGVGSSSVFAKLGLSVPKNVLLVGRVSDGEMKALMTHARAFLFPSYYEGFGIPPLEALSVGCKMVYVSNASALPEIYADAVVYVDPFSVETGIPEATIPERAIENILERYDWVKSAKELVLNLACLQEGKGPSVNMTR